MAIHRSCGILMHITSLPGPYGTGTLGDFAQVFARLLGNAGVRYWQVLPLGPPQEGDSPYQCLSAFAGNPVLIDPGHLAQSGLVTPEEADECRVETNPETASFQEAANKREILLRLAFSRLDDREKACVRAFVEKHRSWVVDYAWFQTIRAHFDGTPWWLWPDEDLRRREPAALEAFVWSHAAEVFYHMFVQYEFYRQWSDLKKEANAAGVGLFGDMPIYVARDSADVWSHADLFELDADLVPIRVSGVPPDYFAEDGQLWGNPLYDWNALKKKDYGWWMARIEHAFTLFDRVRIDHFRGFEAYWAVAADQETARDGVWVEGPGMDLFGLVTSRFAGAEIVAEDLGLLTARTHELLTETGYPGMRVMQFAFDGTRGNPHLPHNYPVNCVAYVGTHDNATLVGWIAGATSDQVRLAAEYCRAESPDAAGVCRAWIQTLWSSAAFLAIVAVQDLLALDGTRRMNVPGVPDGNWRFRLSEAEFAAIDYSWLRKIGGLYGRTPDAPADPDSASGKMD
ncbi:MAG TPA: 4-alpha-glucanotransferase [Clostridia bacterium]